ncbi:MAG: DUF1674 domain-containing protein [Parvibaculales bacterium]
MEDKQDSPETRRRAAAHRALEEAQARRKEKAAQHNAHRPKETGGQEGPEPTRYGDWEKEGIISDF